MVLRSANNNELAGCPVTLDFSACGSDIRVCVVQPDQPARFSAGQPATVVCGGRTVSVDANAIGEVCLSLSGGTSLPYGHGPAPADRPGCCAIYALTKPMGTAIVTIVSYDLNGDRSVNAGDLSRWLAYAGGAYGGYRSKVDYNADGALNAGDLSLWLSCAGLGLAPASIGCDGFCP